MASDKTAKEQLGVDLPEQIEPEAVEAEQAPEEVRPEWLPEKFKDESEYVASYHQLEDELRRRAEAEKQKDEQIESLTSVLQTVQQPQQPPQQDLAEQLMVAYDQDPVGTMIFLAQQTVDQRFQQLQQAQQPQYQQQQMIAGELMATNAERILEAKYPDWSDYGPKVGDVLERNPALIGGEVLSSLDKTTEILEAIYKQVKYDDVAAQLENTSSDQTRMKRQAQTVSGSTGRPAAPSEAEEKINRIIAAAKNSSYSSFRGGA